MKLSNAGVRMPFILSAVVFLSGCLGPESIIADIRTNGSAYTLRIESVMADPRAVEAAAQGRLSARDDESAHRMIANSEAMPGFDHFVYIGEGRFELVVELAGTLVKGASVGFPNTRNNTDNYLQLARLEDGTIEISSPELQASHLAQLNRLPFRPTGTIKVTPAATDRVLSHNADRVPTPLDGAYFWNIGAWEDRVFIRIEPDG